MSTAAHSSPIAPCTNTTGSPDPLSRTSSVTPLIWARSIACKVIFDLLLTSCPGATQAANKLALRAMPVYCRN